jgi:hypothetical protein
MDINQLLSGLLGGLAQSDTAVKTEQGRSAETTAGISGAAANMEGFAGDAIAKSMLASQQAAEIERQKAAAGEQAQIVAGLNPDDLNNEYVRTMAELTATRDQRNAELAKYRSLTETSFLDNPVGYIFNQLELPQVVQRHNNLATQQDALTSDLATRTTLMYQNKTQVTANVADATKEMRLQEAAANEAVAKANLEKMRMENFGKISTARMNELALQDKLIQNASTRYSAGMQKAQFDAMQAERAEARAERKLRMDEAAKDKAIKDAQDDKLAEGLARVSGALGYPVPVTLDDFEKMPASKSKQALRNAAIEGTFGDDLASSLDFVKSGNMAKMQQQDPAFIKNLTGFAPVVRDYSTAANAAAVKTTGKPLKPEDAAKAGADEYVMAIGNAAHDPKAVHPINHPYWDGKFMPYRSQDVTILKLVKTDAGIPVGTASDGTTVVATLPNNNYVKVLETVAATLPPGTPEFRGEDQTAALQSLAVLVRDRKLPLKQAAADLVNYTNTAAAYNQHTMKLASLTLPVQANAYVRIKSQQRMRDSIVGDTMTQAGAENLLLALALDPLRQTSMLFGEIGPSVNLQKQLLDITPEK